MRFGKWSSLMRFQSTPSGRKATQYLHDSIALLRVSIHAFREEGDAYSASFSPRLRRFNPRLPGGRRR